MWQLLKQCVEAAVQYGCVADGYSRRVPDALHRVDSHRRRLTTLLTYTITCHTSAPNTAGFQRVRGYPPPPGDMADPH